MTAASGAPGPAADLPPAPATPANVHGQVPSVTRAERERLNGHPGMVVWFTGLSGSGKSTLANAMASVLHGRGMRTYVLDGDVMRQGLNQDLGFSDADRAENIRRVAEVAKLMADAGLIVITAFISPFQRERMLARGLVGPGNFIEVYLSTPLTVCEQRDVKGLYRQARAGKITNMTGIGSAYEAPEQADVEIDTGDMSVDDAVSQLVSVLEQTAGRLREYGRT